jgi:hypothetical protein
MNAPKKVSVKNPDDRAKPTIKETNIHNNHNGHMNAPKKTAVYDPNSITKTTVKETNIHNNRLGNVGNSVKQNGDGYHIASYEDRETNRQFTSDNEYIGGAGKNNADGYKNASYEDRETNRQYTSDNEYVGVAQSYLDKPTDNSMYEVARLNETKTGVSEGRYPTLSNVKVANGGESINIDIKKLETDRENQYIPVETKLYTQTPVLNKCTVTSDKNVLNDTSIIDRINPDILEAFNNNPYTHSLNSAV